MKIKISQEFSDIIEAYGMQLGMSREEVASFLLQRAVDDLIRSEALVRTHATMKLVRKINRKKGGKS